MYIYTYIHHLQLLKKCAKRRDPRSWPHHDHGRGRVVYINKFVYIYIYIRLRGLRVKGLGTQTPVY